MRSRILAPLIALLALSAGCGGADDSSGAAPAGSDGGSKNSLAESKDKDADEKPTVEIVDSGFGQSGEYVQGIVVVTTDDEAAIGESVTVALNFLDADGQIIATEEQVESFNWVGQELVLPVWLDQSGSKARVASVEPSVSLSDYGMSAEPKAPLPVLDATDIKKAEYGDGFTASFGFTNETDGNLEDLRVGVVCYDGAEKIIGGTSVYPELAPAGKTIRIDADAMVSEKPAACRAFVNYDVF